MQLAAATGELGLVIFGMQHTTAGGHPLHAIRAYQSAMAG